MKFNVYVTLRGPVAKAEMAVQGNPLECANLASLMVRLANNLPCNLSLGLECVGIRIEPVAENHP